MSRTIRPLLIAALTLMLAASWAQAQVQQGRANYYRKAALAAAGIPAELQKQVHVKMLRPVASGTLLEVTPKLTDAQRAKPAEIPEALRAPKFVVGRAGSREVQVLTEAELAQHGIRDGQVSRNLAGTSMSVNALFGVTEGTIYEAGASRSGKSRRYVEVLTKPHVAFDSIGVTFIPAGGTIERSVPIQANSEWQYFAKGKSAAGGQGYEFEWLSAEAKLEIWNQIKNRQQPAAE